MTMTGLAEITKQLLGNWGIRFAVLGMLVLIHWLAPYRYHVFVVPHIWVVAILVSLLSSFAWVSKGAPSALPERANSPLIAFVLALVVSIPALKAISDLRIKGFNAITSATGTLFIRFEKATPIDAIQMADFLLVQVYRGPFTLTASQRASFGVDQVEIKHFAESPGEHRYERLTYGLDFRLSDRTGLFPARLETLSAEHFGDQVDYLVALPFVRLPPGTKFRASLTLVLNGTFEYKFESPWHYPSEFLLVVVPLNDGARTRLNEYKLFDPEKGTLLHYHEIDIHGSSTHKQ